MDSQTLAPLMQPQWFLCTANPRRLLHSVRDSLEQCGIEHYIASHRVLHRRGNGLAEEEESYLGQFFFIRVPLRTALKVKYDHGLDFQYVRGRHNELLTVGDKELEDFRQMVDTMQEKVNFQADVYAVGDRVVVIRGPLCGIVGTLHEVGPRQRSLVIKLAGTLAISCRIAKSDVRKIGDKDGVGYKVCQ